MIVLRHHQALGVRTLPATRGSHDPLDVPRPAEEQRSVGAGRVVTLLVVLSIAALWLQHHLGFEFEKLGFIALAGAVWGAASKLASWLGEESAIGRIADRHVKNPVRKLVQYLARPRPLATVAGAIALMLATVSSVTVRSETPGERIGVSLASLDTRDRVRLDTLDSRSPLLRYFPVFTSPFGRLYEVDADGYVPTQLTVYPLVARHLVVGEDLTPAPSVLFRPFGDGLVALKDGGVFRISRLRDGTLQQLAADSGAASSFLLGRRTAIPDAMLVLWTLEATASGAPDAIRAELLVSWRNVKALTTRGELAPGDCLLAEIRLHGQLRERALVSLSASPLVDVLMREVGVESKGVSSC